MTDPWIRERLQKFLDEHPECMRVDCTEESAGVRLVDIPARTGNRDDDLISLQALCELHLEVEDTVDQFERKDGDEDVR